MPYIPERRPLQARDTRWARGCAAWLAARQVSPNAMSLAGLVSGLLAGGAFAVTLRPGWELAGFLLALVFMLGRGLANLFDGMVAVQTGQQSPVGELYNEVPDRVSDSAIMIGAGYAAGAIPELGYLAALSALFVAYTRAQGKAAGGKQEFCGPMAKVQRITLLQIASVLCAIWPAARVFPDRNYGLMATVLLVICLGCVFTAVRRLSRIAKTLRELARA